MPRTHKAHSMDASHARYQETKAVYTALLLLDKPSHHFLRLIFHLSRFHFALPLQSVLVGLAHIRLALCSSSCKSRANTTAIKRRTSRLALSRWRLFNLTGPSPLHFCHLFTLFSSFYFLSFFPPLLFLLLFSVFLFFLVDFLLLLLSFVTSLFSSSFYLLISLFFTSPFSRSPFFISRPSLPLSSLSGYLRHGSRLYGE